MTLEEKRKRTEEILSEVRRGRHPSDVARSFAVHETTVFHACLRNGVKFIGRNNEKMRRRYV